jgi:hypothetical protein
MPATCSADFTDIFSTNVHYSRGRDRIHNYGTWKYEAVEVLCSKRPLRVRRPFAVIFLLVLPSAGLGVYYMCISAVRLDVLLRKNEFLCDRNLLKIFE